MGAPLTATVPSTSVVSSSGADLLGWSALPLLGSTSNGGSWLFVMDRATGWLSRGSLADAQFLRVVVPVEHPWPFETRSLEGVVIDGDAFAHGAPDEAIAHCVAEAYRTVVSDENVLIACGERRMPRRLRDLRDYGRHSARVWWKALSTHRNLSCTAAASAAFGGDRLTAVTLLDDSNSESTAAAATGRVVLQAPVSNRAPALRSMVTEASRLTGIDLRIERMAVRKIGKTAVFLSGNDGRRYIMRIARSPIARARATRNFEAIQSLHCSALPAALTAAIPRAVVRGTCGPYDYCVEQCLDGHAGPSRHAAQRAGWPIEPVEYISVLHTATAQRSNVDDEIRHRFVVEPITTIGRVCASPASHRILQRLSAHCEAALGECVLPLVRTHGDFTDSNCLFDTTGRLTGVIDWEVSDPRGLPLIDLLQLMPVPGEDARSTRWQRFDAWLELWRDPEKTASDVVLGSYIRGLDLEPSTIPGLVLTHWLTHVAERVDARRDDQQWMRMRVWQPLETLGRILRD